MGTVLNYPPSGVTPVDSGWRGHWANMCELDDNIPPVE